MKWSNKNKTLIKQLINRYHWILEGKLKKEEFMHRKCPFCPHYYCSGWCPNVIIGMIFNCCTVPENIESENPCFENAKYFGLKFRNDIPCKTESNIKKRLQFWEDTLALNKKEFVRKYKRENK